MAASVHRPHTQHALGALVRFRLRCFSCCIAPPQGRVLLRFNHHHRHHHHDQRHHRLQHQGQRQQQVRPRHPQSLQQTPPSAILSCVSLSGAFARHHHYFHLHPQISRTSRSTSISTGTGTSGIRGTIGGRSTWIRRTSHEPNTEKRHLIPHRRDADPADDADPTPADHHASSSSSSSSSSPSSASHSRERIYNLPNLLTCSRLVAAPATAYLVLHNHHAYALALFVYAGLTDLLDGYLARKWNLQTVAGSVLDPMADKALMIILTVTLAVQGAIPASLATLILGRDASLATAAVYYRFASLPSPKTFLRYWDFSLPSAQVFPTTVSKWNTFLQLALIGSTLAFPVFFTHEPADSPLRAGLVALQALVAATTLWSGASYAVLNNVVTILGPDQELKARQGSRGRAIIAVSFGSCVAVAAYLGVSVDFAELKENVPEENVHEEQSEDGK